MYYYEALGDERFQQFCQALIVADFPNAQCLPIGQPDGGRDAFFWQRAIHNGSIFSRPDLIVYQVKFVKSIGARNARDMIKSVVKTEKSKIKKLIKAGLKRYYLITNVAGTAHLDNGSIDADFSHLRQFRVIL